MYQSPIGSGGEHILTHQEGDRTNQRHNMNRPYDDNQQQYGSGNASGIGSGGMAAPGQNNDFYNQGRQLPTQPLQRNDPMHPPIGSAGETTPNYSSDPSIGTAGMIPAQAPRDRNFENAPPIGSGGSLPQQGWNPQVGGGNEGEHEEKHGLIHKILHPFSK